MVRLPRPLPPPRKGRRFSNPAISSVPPRRRFHVTFYYLATGMEGHADVRDYGIVEAVNRRAAIRKIAERESHRPSDIPFWESCLTAKEVQ